MNAPTSEFGPTERALLEARAGEIYREAVARGVIPNDEGLYTADSPDGDALEFLVDLGLLSEESDGWRAVDPALVQARVVGPLGVRAAELMAESARWAATLGDLGQAYRQHVLDDQPITRIGGLGNINRFLESVVGDAQTELLTAQPAGPRPSEQLAMAVERDLSALERGVSLRTLYQHSARRSVETQDYVAEVVKRGAQVRTLDEFFKRLIVVDRRLAVVPGPEGTALAIAVQEPGLVSYLVDIFERNWERGAAFTDRQEQTERAIADDVREMTRRMLMEGYSDTAAAKRMGVATRTFAGYVAAMKAEYAVESRFQLGYAMAMQEKSEEG